MLTMQDARKKVEALLAEWGTHVEGGLAIAPELTLVKPYGWIFFYNARRYLESGDIAQSVAGNGPVVVLAETGEPFVLGTARRPEEQIAVFEQERAGVPLVTRRKDERRARAA
jgi:hypothetical protein